MVIGMGMDDGGQAAAPQADGILAAPGDTAVLKATAAGQV
jgi:hypothetical protein